MLFQAKFELNLLGFSHSLSWAWYFCSIEMFPLDTEIKRTEFERRRVLVMFCSVCLRVSVFLCSVPMTSGSVLTEHSTSTYTVHYRTVLVSEPLLCFGFLLSLRDGFSGFLIVPHQPVSFLCILFLTNSLRGSYLCYIHCYIPV